jgi:Zn-dependent peptidase ImmA (M78 family)
VKFEENICNRFAAEFLFQNLVIKEFGNKKESISFRELVEVQKKYGISIRAIIYRLKDANIFSENRLTEFYKNSILILP